jgi:hypothetical protein
MWLEPRHKRRKPTHHAFESNVDARSKRPRWP